MAFHIVTNRCFLACEKVTSVILEELVPEVRSGRLGKAKSKHSLKKNKFVEKAKVVVTPAQFAITISYYPLSSLPIAPYTSASPRPEQENSIEVRIWDRQEANKLYRKIIQEVQEQHPNEAYLDGLVNKLLEDDTPLDVEKEC